MIWQSPAIRLPLGLRCGVHLFTSVGDIGAWLRLSEDPRSWRLFVGLQWSTNEHSNVGCWFQLKLERHGRHVVLPWEK